MVDVHKVKISGNPIDSQNVDRLIENKRNKYKHSDQSPVQKLIFDHFPSKLAFKCNISAEFTRSVQINSVKLPITKILTIQMCDDLWLRKFPCHIKVIDVETCQIFGIVIIRSIYQADTSICVPNVKRMNISLDKLKPPRVNEATERKKQNLCSIHLVSKTIFRSCACIGNTNIKENKHKQESDRCT